MALNVRRIITGHDKDGKAVVVYDDANKHQSSRRPNMSR
jgi:hypothetical protein